MPELNPAVTKLIQTPELTLFTADEVAVALRIHRSTVSRLLSHLPGEKPELAYVGLGGRKMVRYIDLIKFLENRRVG